MGCTGWAVFQRRAYFKVDNVSPLCNLLTRDFKTPQAFYNSVPVVSKERLNLVKTVVNVCSLF